MNHFAPHVPPLCRLYVRQGVPVQWTWPIPANSCQGHGKTREKPPDCFCANGNAPLPDRGGGGGVSGGGIGCGAVVGAGCHEAEFNVARDGEDDDASEVRPLPAWEDWWHDGIRPAALAVRNRWGLL